MMLLFNKSSCKNTIFGEKTWLVIFLFGTCLFLKKSFSEMHQSRGNTASVLKIKLYQVMITTLCMSRRATVEELCCMNVQQAWTFIGWCRNKLCISFCVTTWHYDYSASCPYLSCGIYHMVFMKAK